jgi:hypothetical protein
VANPDSPSEVVNPKALIVPKMTTAVRDTLIAELGTIIYDTTQDKLCFCKSAAAAAASWEKITSVQEA